jgi:hypothetical protein
MMRNTTYFSILTLNVNGLMLQSKDTEQQLGLENKTQPYIAYKRHISMKK